MKPSKLPPLQNQDEEEPDIIDIAEIFHKLNNNSRSIVAKPYSEYDPESIFPPPSQISVNNDVESDRSKSNCLANMFKRSGVVQVKEQKQMSFIVSKYESHGKKIKRIQVQKITVNNHNLWMNQKDQGSQKNSNINRQLFPNFAPPTNFKITDFFSTKNQFPKPTIINQQTKEEIVQLKISSSQKLQLLSSKTEIEEQKTNIVVMSLIQKNKKKKKIIEDLRSELQTLKKQKQQTKNKLHTNKQAEKQRLRQNLLQSNARKLQFDSFKSSMRTFLNDSTLTHQILPQVQRRLRNLEEFKKKGTSKRQSRKQTHTDEQSIGNNGNFTNSQNTHHLPDKKNYINQWIGKIQKFKEKIQEDQRYYARLYRVNLKVELVPKQIKEALNSHSFLKEYALFDLSYPYSLCTRTSTQLCELNSFNTETLRHQILTILKYPKFSLPSSKSLIQKEVTNLFKMSKKLHNSANYYFLQTTIASSAGQNHEFVVYGRQKNEGFQNIKEAMLKYQSFSQLMVRFIARVCLIALEEIRVKVDIPVFILPCNLYFTPKCDIKFSNILFNNLFLYEQFKAYLKDDKFYYFVSPEALSQKDFSNLSVWSLGILVYNLIYEKYPFEYELEDTFIKQTFFVYNELIFPSKPVVNQKTKDFITACLTSRQKDINQLLKHPFFHK